MSSPQDDPADDGCGKTAFSCMMFMVIVLLVGTIIAAVKDYAPRKQDAPKPMPVETIHEQF